MEPNLALILEHATRRTRDLPDLPTIASVEDIESALTSLPRVLPEKGLGNDLTLEFLTKHLLPGLAPGQSGPRYFGFVTGGVVPAAQMGDILTTMYDQNVGMNLPQESIAAVVESRTLEMLLDLLNLPRHQFLARTLTTGATASNILGLACGREHAARFALGSPKHSVAEDGFNGAIVKVYTDRHHASIAKAAAVVGIGRSNIVDLGCEDGINLDQLEIHLKTCGPELKQGAMVSVSFGEVNTGNFTPNISKLRGLCDKYGAWLHIDAAFGCFAVLVPSHAHLARDLALADSITCDAHKWLNVPYDCGIFFARHLDSLTSIFGPSPATGPPAYLSSVSTPNLAPLSPDLQDALKIPPPLNIGLENSRRFRALPLFCALLALGREGYAEIVQRNIEFANRVAQWMSQGPGKEWYQVLNLTAASTVPTIPTVPTVPLNVVLFCAGPNCPVTEYRRTESNPLGSLQLVKAINNTRKIYVTPGSNGAVRMAVSNWMTGLDRGDGKADFDIVVDVLTDTMKNPPPLL